MDSKVSLIIQLNGVFLLTVLSLFLRRSLKLTALKYWTVSWLSLSFALICLRLAFDQPQIAALLFTYYFFGQYVFGYMLVAGCRSLDGSYTLQARSELWVIPLVIVALGLPSFVSVEFAQTYAIHSLFMAFFFGSAFFAMNQLPLVSFGSRLMRVVLSILAVHCIVHFALFQMRGYVTIPSEIATLSATLDLVLQTTLGCGMVIVLLEKVLTDYQSANDDLRLTQKRLEDLVHKDPLTAAFTRHAFYGFVHKNAGLDSAVSGCIGFFDIDDLKSINDRFGHTAGDMAIRSVVRGIREIIRAEDLIYRWGGDEFFVIMVSMSSEMAEVRMSRLEGILRNVKLGDVTQTVSLAVSWGFTDFTDITALEAAIETADRQMYERKRMRKERRELNAELSSHVEFVPGL